MEKEKKKTLIHLQYLLYLLLCFLIFDSCGLKYEHTPSLETRRKQRENVIENYIHTQVKKDKSYESLAFGPLTVYKPEEFHKLDSLYALKYQYEEQGKIKEFEALGLQSDIDQQIKLAESASDKISYELEHIYSLQEGMDLVIHHDYFSLNEKDSIIVHDPFYKYKISPALKTMQLNYLFELHFLTPNERYISDEELNFILFMKQREQELIETERNLSKFMTHVLSLMKIAQSVGSVDYIDLSKAIARRYVESGYQSTRIEKFGSLIANENANGEVEGYKLLVDFETILETDTVLMRSEMNFSPYLEPNNIYDEQQIK